jgi:glycerate 2-kinase
MITGMDADRFATYSLTDPRILRILSAAIDAVDPFMAVQQYLPRLEGNVHGLAIGKAAIPMMDALAARTRLSSGFAVTKFASGPRPDLYTVIEGGHPIPDERSLRAGERVLEFVSAFNEDDTLVCLISGGGSALVTAPSAGLTLRDLQSLTSLLLTSGVPIHEINTIRRHLDRIKGGGLVRATKAKVISLILSDVIGSPLEAIASGPTAPDPTTRDRVLQIFERYDLENKIPASISQALVNSLETLKPEDPAFGRVKNIIIGDNERASRAAAEQAEHEGINAEILTNSMQGAAREMGLSLGQLLREEISEQPRPFVLIAGGETTVTLQGNGKGGRNQELALAAMNELRDLENVILIALATDGDDGPTDAAGAVVTGESALRAESLGLDAADYLSRNDAYPFFDALDDLLKPGPTGTNVNDLTFLFAL